MKLESGFILQKPEDVKQLYVPETLAGSVSVSTGLTGTRWGGEEYAVSYSVAAFPGNCGGAVIFSLQRPLSHPNLDVSPYFAWSLAEHLLRRGFNNAVFSAYTVQEVALQHPWWKKVGEYHSPNHRPPNKVNYWVFHIPDQEVIKASIFRDKGWSASYINKEEGPSWLESLKKDPKSPSEQTQK